MGAPEENARWCSNSRLLVKIFNLGQKNDARLEGGAKEVKDKRESSAFEQKQKRDQKNLSIHIVVFYFSLLFLPQYWIEMHNSYIVESIKTKYLNLLITF